MSLIYHPFCFGPQCWHSFWMENFLAEKCSEWFEDVNFFYCLVSSVLIIDQFYALYQLLMQIFFRDYKWWYCLYFSSRVSSGGRRPTIHGKHWRAAWRSPTRPAVPNRLRSSVTFRSTKTDPAMDCSIMPHWGVIRRVRRRWMLRRLTCRRTCTAKWPHWWA